MNPAGADLALRWRLDPGGDVRRQVRVVCGARTRAGGPRCLQQIARIWELGPASRRSRLYLPNGFHAEPDGVYRLSKHAEARFRAGKSPHDRAAAVQGPEDVWVWAQTRPPLPCRIQCPLCMAVRTLDPVHLGVEPPGPPAAATADTDSPFV